MIRGLYTSASGMLAETMRTDVISNNLANVDTAGYKKDIAVNKDFGSVLLSRINGGTPQPIGSMGLGTQIDGVYTDHAEGPIQSTGNDFDFAIIGSGYFVVNTPNGLRYTRNGSFSLNGQGELVTQEGYPVMGQNGPIQMNGGNKMTVAPDGSVSVDGVQTDTMQIVRFANQNSLIKQGATLYNAPARVQAQPDTASSVRQGYLEMSNVNVVSSMVQLIANYRAYEANSKAVQSQDSMLNHAVNDVGKVS
jgi:flagellar basal-body rod protein FlgG